MSENKILNKVRSLLGMAVKLEQMKLSDGVSILEADTFEAGSEVFIVTEDDQKIPLPLGQYEMEDKRLLVVTEEGLISEIKEMEEEEEAPVAEAPAVEEEVEVEATAETNPKKTVESIIKETFFAKMEGLQKENEELKAKLSAQTTEVAKEEAPVELAAATEEPKPILHNPENVNRVEMFKLSPKKNRSTMDTILEKFNK